MATEPFKQVPRREWVIAKWVGSLPVTPTYIHTLKVSFVHPGYFNFEYKPPPRLLHRIEISYLKQRSKEVRSYLLAKEFCFSEDVEEEHFTNWAAYQIAEFLAARLKSREVPSEVLGPPEGLADQSWWWTQTVISKFKTLQGQTRWKREQGL